MSVQDETIVENGQENGVNLFTMVGDFAAKTFFVGLGTVGYAQDELKKLVEGSGSFINKLEERGESMSQSGRERLDQQRDTLNIRIETRQGQVKDLGSMANESIEKASGVVLTRANIPTSEDIQSLSEQIDVLNQKVDELRDEQEELAVEPVTGEEETPTEA